MLQNAEIEDYLSISIPFIAGQKFTEIVATLETIEDRFTQTSQCLKLIMNIQAVLHKMTKLLKSQRIMFLFAEVLDEKYIMPLQMRKKGTQASENGFQEWMINKLDMIQFYVLQMFMRLQCLRMFCESKTYLDKVPEKNHYKKKFYDELGEAIQCIRTQNRLNPMRIDESKLFIVIIETICQKCKSKSFFTFLINFLNDQELFEHSTRVQQLQQETETKRLGKLSKGKSMLFSQEYQHPNQPNHSIKFTTVASLDKFTSECSNGSHISNQTPMMNDTEGKENRIYQYIKSTASTGFAKNEHKIDSMKGFHISQFNQPEVSKILVQENDTDEIKRNVLQPVKPTASSKSDEQQSLNDQKQQQQIGQTKIPRRTIGQGINARYKVAMQVKRDRVTEQRGVSTRLSNHTLHKKGTRYETHQSTKPTPVQDPSNQLKFCQEVVHKLAEIKRSRKKQRPTIVDANILALDTPKHEMQDSEYHSRSFPYF